MSGDRNGWRRTGGWLVALGVLGLMIATEPRLAIVWDEGYTIGREARVREWLGRLVNPGRAPRGDPPEFALVQPDVDTSPPLPRPRSDALNSRAGLLRSSVIAWYWPFAREEPHGHPSFYAIVGLAGDLLAPSWSVLSRARLGPMIAFSLTSGAIFVFFARRWGLWPALAASGAWTLHPHLFAMGHYAHYDGLLSSLWVGAMLAFTSAVEVREEEPSSTGVPRWGWVIVFGLMAGWAAGTKFTGWFLPLPFLAWSALYRDRRGFWTLAVGGLVALLTLYAFNPPFWADPVSSVRRFLASNLSRTRTILIPVLFLGKVVKSPNESLPWYNTLLWTLLATPVGFLGLALLRLESVVRRRLGQGRGLGPDRGRAEPFGVLVFLHWAFLLALRALPHTPGHDGVRQFLPAFGALAMLSGLGAASVIERSGRWGKALVVASLAEGALSLALMMPVPLSYYSPIVGGLPGATALGMEPTYYWDGLTDEALDWLNRQTPPGHKIRFSTFPLSMVHLHQTGRLRPEVRAEADVPAAWYVLQNRPGLFREVDRALRSRGRPSFVVRCWGVPLIWIYPMSEYERLGPSQEEDARRKAR